MSNETPLLSVAHLFGGYKDQAILEEINLEVTSGRMIAILGGNGAGKTSLLRAISRTLPWTKGTISYAGTDLSPMKPHRLAALGISHIPERRGTFGELTVRENLLVAAQALKNRRARTQAKYDEVLGLLPILQRLTDRQAAALSGGEQQLLAIGRGLMSEPKLLLLDEPSLGLAPLTARSVFDFVASLRAELGLGVLVVEQNVRLAMRYADYGIVLQRGRAVVEGVPEELENSDVVKKAYLGG